MPETIGEAFVAIRPDTKNFGNEAKGGISTALKGIATGIAAVKVGQFFSGALDEAREAQKVGAQTTAVLKSTGNAANTTSKEIGDLASALSKKAGVDDEVIQSGENLLLTFTNIRNEVGKGNKIFDRAATVALDMATAMKASTGGEVDLKGASIQLGKALNDPLKGITALTRVGVTFTQQQKDQIGLAVLFGDTLGAQKIILGEVEKEFGGSAAAQATAADKATVAWGNLKEAVGTALLPVLDKLVAFSTPILEFFSQNQEAAAGLAITVGVVLVGAFAAWAAGAVTAAATTLFALAPFIPIIAAIGLAIADGILLWQRYGDDVVKAIQPAIDIVNGLLGAAKDVLEFLGLIDEASNINENGGVGSTPYGPPLQGGFYPQYHPQGDLSFLDPNSPDFFIRQLYPPTTATSQYSQPIGPGLNGYADGGWVDGPLGQPQLAVVHGGERVLTPEQQRGWNARPIQVNVTTSTPITDRTRFAVELHQRLALVAEMAALG